MKNYIYARTRFIDTRRTRPCILIQKERVQTLLNNSFSGQSFADKLPQVPIFAQCKGSPRQKHISISPLPPFPMTSCASVLASFRKGRNDMVQARPPTSNNWGREGNKRGGERKFLIFSRAKKEILLPSLVVYLPECENGGKTRHVVLYSRKIPLPSLP